MPLYTHDLADSRNLARRTKEIAASVVQSDRKSGSRNSDKNVDSRFVRTAQKLVRKPRNSPVFVAPVRCPKFSEWASMTIASDWRESAKL